MARDRLGYRWQLGQYLGRFRQRWGPSLRPMLAYMLGEIWGQEDIVFHAACITTDGQVVFRAAGGLFAVDVSLPLERLLTLLTEQICLPYELTWHQTLYLLSLPGVQDLRKYRG